MLSGMPQTLSKAERLNSMTLIGRLFNEAGSRSMTVFPLRAVYTAVEREEGVPAVRILVSVPKRKLHKAVDRNMVKRQVREAYRKNKSRLIKSVEDKGEKALLVAFVWIDDTVRDSSEVEKSMQKLINRLSESL